MTAERDARQVKDAKAQGEQMQTTSSARAQAAYLAASIERAAMGNAGLAEPPHVGQPLAREILSTLRSHSALVAENERLNLALDDLVDAIDQGDSISAEEFSESLTNARALTSKAST